MKIHEHMNETYETWRWKYWNFLKASQESHNLANGRPLQASEFIYRVKLAWSSQGHLRGVRRWNLTKGDQLAPRFNELHQLLDANITCTQQNLTARSTSSHHFIRRRPRLRQEELDTAAVRTTGKLLPCLILSSVMEPTWPGMNDIMHWRQGQRAAQVAFLLDNATAEEASLMQAWKGLPPDQSLVKVHTRSCWSSLIEMRVNICKHSKPMRFATLITEHFMERPSDLVLSFSLLVCRLRAMAHHGVVPVFQYASIAGCSRTRWQLCLCFRVPVGWSGPETTVPFAPDCVPIWMGAASGRHLESPALEPKNAALIYTVHMYIYIYTYQYQEHCFVISFNFNDCVRRMLDPRSTCAHLWSGSDGSFSTFFYLHWFRSQKLQVSVELQIWNIADC